MTCDSFALVVWMGGNGVEVGETEVVVSSAKGGAEPCCHADDITVFFCHDDFVGGAVAVEEVVDVVFAVVKGKFPQGFETF